MDVLLRQFAPYAGLSIVPALLALYAFAWIVGCAHISEAARKRLRVYGMVGETLANLLECPGCFGFWEGVFAGMAMRMTFPTVFVAGLIVCCTNLILDAWVRR